MKSALYVDSGPRARITWGQPRRKWRKGHAVYHEPDLDLAQPLYKYLKAQDAFRMLSSKTLWFSSVYNWDDPHEEWWCEVLFRTGSHLGGAHPYGSCWTRRYRDEPFWRMYSCECNGDDYGKAKALNPVRVLPAVRIRANTAKLFTWLTNAIGAQSHACKGYMGNVRYCPIEQLTSEATLLRKHTDNTSLAAASGLMMKRLAFEFEHEVRMLWIDRQNPRTLGRAIPFEPSDLIEQVMIGPTKAKDRARYDEVFGELVMLGIDPSMIEPSATYSPPALF